MGTLAIFDIFWQDVYPTIPRANRIFIAVSPWHYTFVNIRTDQRCFLAIGCWSNTVIGLPIGDKYKSFHYIIYNRRWTKHGLDSVKTHFTSRRHSFLQFMPPGYVRVSIWHTEVFFGFRECSSAITVGKYYTARRANWSAVILSFEWIWATCCRGKHIWPKGKCITYFKEIILHLTYKSLIVIFV